MSVISHLRRVNDGERLFVLVADEPLAHLRTNDAELPVQVVGRLAVGVRDLGKKEVVNRVEQDRLTELLPV